MLYYMLAWADPGEVLFLFFLFVDSSDKKKLSVQLIFSYPTALAMIASGKVNVKPLITHRYKLQDSVKAFETVASGEGIKVMISCT